MRRAIEDTKVTLQCGVALTLRVCYATHYLLGKWGKNVATANSIELAAAACGSVHPVTTAWIPQFGSDLELAGMMSQEDENPVAAAVIDALKKAYPEADFSAQPIPEAASTPDTAKTIG
jgi:hypothetical protein